MSVRLSKYQYYHTLPGMLFEKPKEYVEAYYECKGSANPLFEATRSGNYELAQQYLYYSKDDERFYPDNEEVLQQNFISDQALDIPSLHFSILENREDLALLLIEHGYDVNSKNTTGFTALHHCMKNHLNDLARILILRNANVHMHDLTGKTPLHIASLYNNARGCRLLLENDAEIDAYSNFANTPVKLAINEDSLNALEILIDLGANLYLNNCLQNAVAEGKEPCVRVILSRARSLDINRKDLFGVTAIHQAMIFYNTSLTRLLLEHGVDLISENRENRTAILLAQDLSFHDIFSSLKNAFLLHRAIFFISFYNLSYLLWMKSFDLLSTKLRRKKRFLIRSLNNKRNQNITILALSFIGFLSSYFATRSNIFRTS